MHALFEVVIPLLNNLLSPLHLAAPRGLVETTELLLRRGADFTATDKKCFTPILACAKDDNVALCLASMLVEYFKNSSNAEGSNRASVGMLGMSRPSVYAVSVCSLIAVEPQPQLSCYAASLQNAPQLPTGIA